MYVFGGYGGDGRLDDCWEFNFGTSVRGGRCAARPLHDPHQSGHRCLLSCLHTETRAWKKIEYLSESPGVRENNGVVEHDRCLYLFGGYNGSEWLNDFWQFSLDTRRWRKIEPRGDAPASRFGYVSMTYEDVFLLFGGYDGTTWLNDMHEYNFGAWCVRLHLPRLHASPLTRLNGGASIGRHTTVVHGGGDR